VNVDWTHGVQTMQQALKFGVSAVTTDGRDVGRLHHVVIDTATGKATAITVERGLIESGNLLKPGGWTMPRDQRVEIGAVLGADEGKVRISLTEEEFWPPSGATPCSSPTWPNLAPT
jgi:sporulation protein YlmC with PRC-barrel domain